jgi:outer membrane protein assembly factor BamD
MHLNRFLRGRTLVGRLLLIVTVLILASACRAKKVALKNPADADRYLFQQGTASIEQKRWMKAREYYRRIVDDFPQSRYRPDAKLGLADTYLGEGSVEALVLGANEYREFMTYYPTHERADYAQYKLGLCFHQQMLAPQRDQTQTKSAIKEFEAFVERFPKSQYLGEVRQKLQASRDRLSDADYEVGYFYYRAKWYPGAITRFRDLLKDNPTYGRRDALYFYLADCYIRIQSPAQALPLLDKLTKECATSEFLERAKKTMSDIQNGTLPALNLNEKPLIDAGQQTLEEKKKHRRWWLLWIF